MSKLLFLFAIAAVVVFGKNYFSPGRISSAPQKNPPPVADVPPLNPSAYGGRSPEETTDNIRSKEASSEEELLLSDIKKTMSLEIKAPVMDRFKKAFTVRKNYKEAKAEAGRKLYLLFLRAAGYSASSSAFYFCASVFILVFAFLFSKKASYYLAVKIFSGYGYLIARTALFLISFGMIFFHFVLSVEIRLAAASALSLTLNAGAFAGPLVLLVSSAAALRMYDYNFPVYNRAAASFILPAVAFFLCGG